MLPLVACLALASGGVQAEDPAAFADSVWAALAEPGALESLGTVRMRGTARSVNGRFEGPVEEWLHGDGRALQRTEFEGSDPTLFGVDGRVSYEAWSGEGVAKFGWHAAADLRRFSLHRHGAGPGLARGSERSPWRTLYRSVAIGGLGELAGKACVRLVLEPRTAREHALAEHPPDSGAKRTPAPDVLWVDEATRLPVRLETEMFRPFGGEVRLKETFADWRRVDGVLFAMSRTLEVPGAGLEYRFTEVATDAEAPPGTFDLPPEMTATVAASHPDAVRLPDPEWRVTEREAQPAAVLRLAGGAEDAAIATARESLRAFAARRGIEASGPPFLRREGAGEGARLVVGLPLARLPERDPEAPAIEALTLPAGAAVEGVHRGPRRRLDESLARLDWFLRSRALAPSGAPLEVELPAPNVGDGESDGEARYRLSLVQPLAD